MRTAVLSAALAALCAIAPGASGQEREPTTEAEQLKSVWATGDAFAYDYNPLYEFVYRYPAQAFALPALAKHLDGLKREALAGAIETSDYRREDAARDEPMPASATQPFTSQTFWTLKGDTPRLMSLEAELSVWIGGVHGEHGSDALLWDKRMDRPVEVLTLFDDGLASQRKAYCAALDALREKNSDGHWKATPGGKYLDQWDCPVYEQLTILPVGVPGQAFDTLRLIASPYVAGPFSDGYYKVDLPITRELRDHIVPEYRDAFRIHAR